MWKVILLIFVLCPLVSCVCSGCTDYTRMELDDPDLQKSIDVLHKVLNEHQISKYVNKLVEIIDAKKSVCSEKRWCGETASYQFKTIIAKTDCLRKEVNHHIDDCELQENAKTYLCTFKVSMDKKGLFRSFTSGCSAQS